MGSCQTLAKGDPLSFLFTMLMQDTSPGRLVLEGNPVLFTSENGGFVDLSLRLSRGPTSDVLVGPVTVSNPNEGRISQGSFLRFTQENWSENITVRVTGVDDLVKDGNTNYQVKFGTFDTMDQYYLNQSTLILDFQNLDDEGTGIAATPNQNILTTEAGTKAIINVVLQSQPSKTVVISNLRSSDSKEVQLDKSTLTFTPENWNQTQQFTITGIPDGIADGTKNFSIISDPITSADPVYQGKTFPTVSGRNGDIDGYGFTVIPITDAITTEAGGTAQVQVFLNRMPTSNVAINSISSSNTNEGFVFPTLLTFTPSNWNVPQTLTITGVDDSMADGDQTFSIISSNASSTDSNYNGRPGPQFSNFTNQDDDTKGFLVTPNSSVTFSENGGSQNYTMQLRSRPPPGKTVRIMNFISSNANLISISPTFLVFDSNNWDIPQTVTVSGIDNFIDEDTRTVFLNWGFVDQSDSNRDIGYDAVSVPSAVSFLVTDDDTTGFTRTATAFPVAVDENAGPLTAPFQIRLNSRPLFDVTLPTISSSNTLEVTVSPSTLTFTPSNWNIPQTVTLSSVLDGAIDVCNPQPAPPNPCPPTPVTISFGPAISADPRYDGMQPPDTQATNNDSGSARVFLSLAGGTTNSVSVTENAVYEVLVQLSIAPTSTVTIGPILSSDNAVFEILDAAGNPTNTRTLQFTTTPGQSQTISGSTSTSGFNVNQSIRIRSVNDFFDDGDRNATITFPGASGPFYTGKLPESLVILGYNQTSGQLVLTSVDDDTRGFEISSTSATITENGGATTFQFRLRSAPCLGAPNCTGGSVDITFNKAVPLTGQIPYLMTGGNSQTFNFNSTNWNTNQSITLTAEPDNIDQVGNITYTIASAVITGTTDYSGLDPPDFNLTIQDTDNPANNSRILIALVSGDPPFTSEAGATTRVQARLATRPLPGNTVTVRLTSNIPTEGRLVNPITSAVQDSVDLTFNDSNWSTNQLVTVEGTTDPTNLDSSDVTYVISAEAISETGSKPAFYRAFDDPVNRATSSSVTITNWDLVGDPITVVRDLNPNLSLNEGQSLRFYLLLRREPDGDVTIPFSQDLTPPCQILGTITQFRITYNGTPMSSGNIVIPRATWNRINNSNTIEVTAIQDNIRDGTYDCALNLGPPTSIDPYYNGGVIAGAAYSPIRAVDNSPVPGLTVSGTIPSPPVTSKEGAELSFNVALTSRPLSLVAVNLATSELNIATVTPSVLTFTPLNYTTAQSVVVKGSSGTGDSTFNLTSSLASAGEEAEKTANALGGLSPYDGWNGNVLNSITSVDILYNVVVCTTPIGSCGTPVLSSGGYNLGGSDLTTNDDGARLRFRVSLRARPTSNVTIGVTSSNTLQGTVSPINLTFTPSNWNNLQSVIVTGINDGVPNGNVVYSVTLGNMNSTDPSFSNKSMGPGLTITNISN